MNTIMRQSEQGEKERKRGREREVSTNNIADINRVHSLF